MSRRIRKPELLAIAHRQHRYNVGPSISDVNAFLQLTGFRPQYQIGPRAGQQLADARKMFDAMPLDARRYLTRP